MGAWGIKHFENDGALDWLADFMEAPSESKLLDAFSTKPTTIQPGLLGELLGRKPEALPGELDGEEVLAAAEVVATILGRPDSENPGKLDNLPQFQLDSNTPKRAVAAIDEMMENSNLKDCWEETDDFTSWRAEVDDLRSRLLK